MERCINCGLIHCICNTDDAEKTVQENSGWSGIAGLIKEWHSEEEEVWLKIGFCRDHNFKLEEQKFYEIREKLARRRMSLESILHENGVEFS